MDDLRRTAVHEAGHAVVRYVYARRNPDLVRQFETVSIEASPAIRQGDQTSHAEFWVNEHALEEMERSDIGSWKAQTRRRVEHQIMVCVAGVVAEELHGLLDPEAALPYRTDGNETVDIGAGYADIRAAYDLTSYMEGTEESRDSFLDWLGHRTRYFLAHETVAPMLSAMADALQERKTMTYQEATEVIYAAGPSAS